MTTQIKVKALYDRIDADIDASDIKWTLFVSAAQSYRFDSRLSPYPPQFIAANDKFDIDKIIRLIVKVPAMDILRQQLKLNSENIPVEIVDLLHWVLCRPADSPVFSSVDKSNVYASLILSTSTCTNSPKTFFLFSFSLKRFCKKLILWCREFNRLTFFKSSLRLVQWLRHDFNSMLMATASIKVVAPGLPIMAVNWIVFIQFYIMASNSIYAK